MSRQTTNIELTWIESYTNAPTFVAFGAATGIWIEHKMTSLTLSALAAVLTL